MQAGVQGGMGRLAKIANALAISVVVSGCSLTAASRTELKCPPEPPVLQCQPWPSEEHPSTLRDLQEAFLRGEAAHASCSELAGLWREIWEEC